MIIKEVSAQRIFDSRKEPTIHITVETKKGKFQASAPSGKSRGRFEASPYKKNLQDDIDFLNNIDKKNLSKLKIEKFQDLKEVEGLVSKKIGANSLFALESAILKALAKENEKELWEFLSRDKNSKFPMPIGNAIGGGLHSLGLKAERKPDFQEFLFIPQTKKFEEAVSLNRKAYEMAGEMLKARTRNDEGAWQTSLNNEEVLRLMDRIKARFGNLYMGVDIAASTFFDKKNEIYNYKNKVASLSKKQQINFIALLERVYNLFYIEDPLEEQDFDGFAELMEKTNGKSGKNLIVGDDLTVTNLTRLKKAFQKKSINAIIVKPNQQGSLLKVKEICDFCKKRDIKIIFSHRSGETFDSVIADLALAWKADFIKTGIFGKEREAKLKRLVDIENHK